MDYQVIWSDTAVSDLREICAYIAQENPDAASRVGRGILDHVRLLSSFPFIGPAYPRGARGPLREIVFRPIASSMMFPRTSAGWKSFTSGMRLDKNPCCNRAASHRAPVHDLELNGGVAAEFVQLRFAGKVEAAHRQ